AARALASAWSAAEAYDCALFGACLARRTSPRGSAAAGCAIRVRPAARSMTAHARRRAGRSKAARIKRAVSHLIPGAMDAIQGVVANLDAAVTTRYTRTRGTSAQRSPRSKEETSWCTPLSVTGHATRRDAARRPCARAAGCA